MSPIDDELRAALHGRAQSLAPAPDPLADIERRAKRIQRNRIGAAVAGSAMAVAAIALVVPALQDTTATPGPRPPMVASPEPTPTLAPAPVSYALDPADPWAFRGVEVDEGSRATIQREYATRTQGAEVLVTPLFAQVWEPAQQLEVVFLAEVDGAYRWGVAAATESGPEFLWDAELPPQSVSLAAALPGDEVARLLVVSHPEATAIDYAADSDSGYAAMGEIERGVATVALDGDPAADAYRVTLPDGAGYEQEAPDLPPAPAPEDEGPGTGTPPEVDTTAYGFEPADAWAYRGPVELVAAPDLASADGRLFTAKHGDGWTTRPLYAAESEAGVNLLMTLYTRDDVALVSTTWQRGDRAPEQTDQVVGRGQLLVQASVPTDLDDGTRLLVALASPQVGGIVLTGEGGARPDGIDHPGVGLWVVETGESAVVRLYTEGDGVEFLAAPAFTS